VNSFAQALAKLTGKILVGADLSSSQWADVPAGLRDRALFSARMTNVHQVQTLFDGITDILNPRTERRADRVTESNPEGFVTVGKNDATVRAELKQMYQRMGYDPGDQAGGIQDLSSDARINLQLRMNVEAAQGYGQFVQGQAEGVIDAFPAQELFRAEDRAEPRPWSTRWMQAGGQIFPGGRMIALKNDPIWEVISAFGTPYPPFDFGSGMWTRDVDREEAVALGLLAEDEAVEPIVEQFNSKLEASTQGLHPDMLASLKRSFGNQVEISGDSIQWREAA